MCGITGVFAFTEAGRTALDRLQAAAEALRHRGPDGAGLLVRGDVGLAHRRLAIIGLEEAACQPMQDASGRFSIVYNGEVFNYKELRRKLQDAGYSFRTTSDTEVVLQLFLKEGPDCLKKLKGFFVFAIHDAQHDSLFIARDRFGEKPLLYYKDADKFLFGSELGALLELGVPREVDYTSLYQYLQLTYVPAPASMLKGVKKLLPGHFLYIQNNKVQQQMWYRLPFDAAKAATNPLNYPQQQAKLKQVLERAVVDRLTADIPVGAFLSGGIDSSVVVALAAKHVPHLKTFSVGFKDAPFFDETRYARLVAAKYKTDHTEINLTTQDLHGHLYNMLDSLGEPFADSSALAVYALSSHAGREVKAVLSGDGADELFAGYNKHMAEFQLLRGGAKIEAVEKLSFLWDVLPKSRQSFAANKIRQLQRFAAGARLNPSDRYWLWATWANEAEAINLLHDRYRATVAGRLYQARKRRLLSCLESNHYDLNSVLCADWQLVLGNDMVPKIDLMGMAHGLEVRSPFLDHRVAKFAFSLPVSSKIDASIRKKILQDTYKSMLPPELYKRPKKGFEVPLADFLKNEAADLMQQYMSDELIIAQGIFDVHQIKKLRKSFAASAAGSVQTQVWSLLVFQHWWKKWIM
ncbi:asparagine synthase (glutamine-hydrolyzing) [Pontibacter ruber]|uniref:asparagine synthase (glutamine-hydrolyzing) n=1 Tax=Pontibacter ruber TaxID=1343895 RepID=A0ABW5D3X5_9BACT|nr:asparagine synthase (glutamine-hydrolyzing) [Pontibacter ruber]